MQPLTNAWLDAARQSIASEYWRNGFNEVLVVPSIQTKPDGASATVRFMITEGVPQKIASIDVSGAPRTNPSYIRRQIRFKVDDPVDYTKVNLTRTKLYDTEIFRHVEIDMQPGKNGYNARIHLDESPPWIVRYGIGLIYQIQTGDQRMAFT